jgi:hypothetical protein
MERSAGPTENRKPAGVMRCKECGGDVFSVTNMEDQTPITCDRCEAVVGRWADVRALTHIPERKKATRIFDHSERKVHEKIRAGSLHVAN